jgi:hypothetical protein
VPTVDENRFKMRSTPPRASTKNTGRELRDGAENRAFMVVLSGRAGPTGRAQRLLLVAFYFSPAIVAQVAIMPGTVVQNPYFLHMSSGGTASSK